MKGTPLQRVDQAVRQIFPFVLTLLLVLIVATPSRLPGFASITPQLPLIGIYYWAIYRPDLLRPWAAFLLGVIADVIGGTPMGVSSLVFLAAQGVCASQRRFFIGKSFLVAWWGFGMVCAGSLVMEWAFSSLILVKLLTPRALLFQFLMTAAFYPLLSWVFMRVQLGLLQRA